MIRSNGSERIFPNHKKEKIDLSKLPETRSEQIYVSKEHFRRYRSDPIYQKHYDDMLASFFNFIDVMNKSFG